MESNKTRKISVLGLGYVGLPIAVAFGQLHEVIAFDINEKRIQQLKQGNDINREIEETQLQKSELFLTSTPQDLRRADFHIITVPSPINQAKQPDFSFLINASKLLGEVLKQGDIVVYESTVYPGATEEKCIPILEEFSGLKSGKDFFVGYSPERINPGDKQNTLSTIVKIVSAQTPEALKIIEQVYSQVINNIHPVSSIKVAEASKIIENTQRDINIALINEFSTILHRLHIDTHEVLTAASTKWNFLPFKPGLVGGHCIGVDPYYLTHKASECDMYPEIILAGRRINNNMGKYIAAQTIKLLSSNDKKIKNARIGVLGFTFKENCTDIRNTRVIDIISELNEHGVITFVHDPLAEPEQVKNEYGFELVNWTDLSALDAVILAVPHNYYMELSTEELLGKLLEPKIVVDIKSVLDLRLQECIVWRL